MIEDDWLSRDLLPAQPVQALRQVSYDMTLARPIALANGSSITALEAQWELYDRARKFAQEHGLECIGGDEVGHEVLRRWEEVLTGLEADPSTLAGQVDWIAKHRLLDGYRERHGLRWDDARIAAMDLQYHDLRPEKSLAARVGLERIASDEEMALAVSEPPPDTRAFFRGRCLQRWPESIVAANWDSLVFDVGGDPLRRVPMMEPLRGTEAHVGSLIDGCETAADLLEKLGQ